MTSLGMWWLAVLITVVSCRSTIASRLVVNMDRLMVKCDEDKMRIELRKDLGMFTLIGDEPECKPTEGKVTNAFNKEISVKMWTLPLKKEGGACGMQYAPLGNSPYFNYNVTMYTPQGKPLEVVTCTDIGVLDKRRTRITLDTMNSEAGRIHPLTASEGERMEVKRGTTIRATFKADHFPKEISVSLQPMNCFIINERTQKRLQVVERGCPILSNDNNRTVVIGSESADHVTGDHTHLFFNAEPYLLPGEDISSLPTLRLQCDVFPCKGHNTFHQIIGIELCPTVAMCQSPDKRIDHQPNEMFEINQFFSLAISPVQLDGSLHRYLDGPLYPSIYWQLDSDAATVHPQSMPLCALLILVGLVTAAITLLALALSAFWRYRVQPLLRAKWMTIDQKVPMDGDGVYPEKALVNLEAMKMERRQ